MIGSITFPLKRERGDTMGIVTFLYESAEEAERVLRTEGWTYLMADHQIEAGNSLPTEEHQSDEWMIFDKGNGSCRVERGRCPGVVNLSPNNALVLPISKKVKHSIEAIADIFYTVLREDGSAEIVR